MPAAPALIADDLIAGEEVDSSDQSICPNQPALRILRVELGKPAARAANSGDMGII